MTWWHANDIPAGLDKHIDNPSLFLSKYVDVPEPDEKEKRDKGKARDASLQHLIRNVRSKREFLDCFRESRRAFVPAGVLELRLTLRARLIVNHAGGVLENAGLALDRLTGEPYIPGSALKGIARTAAQAEGASQAETTLVFGYEKDSCPDIKLPDGWSAFAGSVAFLPAYPVTDAQLEMDILTCHHKDYYAGKSTKALDNESPNPQVFPVVKAGAEFMFVLASVSPTRACRMAKALGLPGDFPLAKAKEWLIKGLTERGVGAKTTAGYGWFEYDEAKENQRLQEAAEIAKVAREAAEQKAAEEKWIAGLSPVDRALEEITKLGDGEPFINVAKALDTKAPDYQRAFLKALGSSRKETWKRYKKNKPELAQKLRELAGRLGEVLP